VSGFVDGQWHRLHPVTQLFRGGLVALLIAGLVIGNLRERVFELFVGESRFGEGEFTGDPLDYLLRENLVLAALGVTAIILVLAVGGFALSWRLHTFRITDEVVEVRSGILFRTHRKGRLDRVQGINIARPFIPRLFGAAKLEISVAGNDSNVQLAYLRSRDADALRRQILLLASGAVASEGAGDAPGGAAGGVSGGAAGDASIGMLEGRAREFLAPELDPSLAEPQSVVHLNFGRLVGSTVLSETTILFLMLILGLAIAVGVTGDILLLFGFLPAVLGLAGFLLSRVMRSLRYSIAATADGVRVGFGLLSTSNETLPPGRIHSVRVSQPLLWRPFGWWQIAVNRASRSSQQGAGGHNQTTILPVGNLADITTVLRLLLPDVTSDRTLPLIERGMLSPGGDDGFTNSPSRARALRWFSRRRNGFALLDTGILLRTGAIWRALTIVPFARVQSVSVRQGPVLRPLRLASLNVHTVSGPIAPRIGAIDRATAAELVDVIAAAAVRSASVDTSHRWRADATVGVGAGGGPTDRVSADAAPPTAGPA
jgi:putative membrane protein